MSRSYRRIMQGDRLCCRYFVGKSHVEIIIPGDPRTKITPTIWDLKGISVETFERGQRKGTPDGAVTPSEVASYVAGVQVRTGVSHER